MDNIPIICVVCGNEFSEMEYPTHMQKSHPSGQAGSIAAQRNIPKQSPVDLPPGVSVADLPDPDFLATIAEMEKEAAKPQKPVLPQPTKSQGSVDNSPPRPVTEKNPITLTYKYTGQDEVGHDVKTIELNVLGKHFAIAYCTVCDKDIMSREVEDLEERKIITIPTIDWEGTDIINNTCQKCNKPFKNQRALTMHKWRAHKDGK